MACPLPKAPVPALAATWTAPQGCEIFMTVQAKACRVSNYCTCAADDPGDQWRADFDQEGLFFQSRINREAEWVESYDSSPTVRQTLDPNRQTRPVSASFCPAASTPLPSKRAAMTAATAR